MDIADGEDISTYHRNDSIEQFPIDPSSDATMTVHKCESQQQDQVQGKIEKAFTFGGTNSVINKYRKARATMKRVRRHLSTLHGESPSSVSESKEISAEWEHEDETINLSISDFGTMTIIGQYNLGFILALCPNHQLWILDQVSETKKLINPLKTCDFLA